MEQSFLESFIGRTVDVLFESYENFKATGHTKHYINVSTPAAKDIGGHIQKIKIEAVDGKKLMGKIQ